MSVPEVDEVVFTPAQEARAAVQVGLYVSALRCVITYLIAPALGFFGLVLGPVGTVLQLVGALTATMGARRLWRLGHRARYPYVLLAFAVDLLAVISVVETIAQLTGSSG